MGFNVTMVDPTYTGPKTGTLLPKGAYRLEVVHTEEKSTSKGDGKYVELAFSVLEPSEFNGSMFYENVNTENPNAKAVEIGQRTLAGIGNAIGVLEGEFEDLQHKPFYAEVQIEKSTNPQYSDKNRLGRIYWEEGSAPKQLGPSGPPAASTAVTPARPTVVASNPAPKPAAGAARPWGKR